MAKYERVIVYLLFLIVMFISGCDSHQHSEVHSNIPANPYLRMTPKALIEEGNRILLILGDNPNIDTSKYEEALFNCGSTTLPVFLGIARYIVGRHCIKPWPEIHFQNLIAALEEISLQYSGIRAQRVHEPLLLLKQGAIKPTTAFTLLDMEFQSLW